MGDGGGIDDGILAGGRECIDRLRIGGGTLKKLQFMVTVCGSAPIESVELSIRELTSWHETLRD